jgi:kynurenine formamidase
MTRSGGDYCCGLKEGAGFGFSDDVVMLATHGTTHIDALAHIWRDGHMYNGFAATEVSGRGAARCGIDKLPPIVTRALFANCAAPDGARVLGPIHIDELLAAIELGGVAPLPGDALLVRTGWMTLFKAGQANTECTAGLHADCADWIISSGFVLVAADNVAVEVIPSGDPTCAVPLHVRLIRDHGVYLSELLDLDTLAEEQRAACMLMLAPLPIRGGVGSPVNPVAVF